MAKSGFSRGIDCAYLNPLKKKAAGLYEAGEKKFGSKIDFWISDLGQIFKTFGQSAPSWPVRQLTTPKKCV